MWTIQRIISNGDYNACYIPNHPKASKKGYVQLHRIVLENYLGRVLEDDEIPHHINEDRKDNRIENIELCLRSVHSRYHRPPVTWINLICDSCGKEFKREKRRLHQKNKKNYCTRECYRVG